MMTIKVLGSGCANCKKLESLTRQAVNDLGLDAAFVKVTDVNEILAYDVFSTPALVINDKVVVAGRIPSPAELTAWLKELPRN